MRVTKKIKDQLLQQAEGKCEYCGVKVNEKTAMIDHKIPLSKGGTSTIENLAIACPKCNILKADRIFGSISNPVVESAAKLWLQAFIKSPRITVVASLIVSSLTIFSLYMIGITQKSSIENQLSKNLEFKTQIQQLDETERNLKELLKFVDTQKVKVTQYELNIQKLEKEKQNLEPLVNADKAMVEALFKAQEIRAQENASKERWIGFGLGIVASIVASFCMVIVRYFFTVKRKIS